MRVATSCYMVYAMTSRVSWHDDVTCAMTSRWVRDDVTHRSLSGCHASQSAVTADDRRRRVIRGYWPLPSKLSSEKSRLSTARRPVRRRRNSSRPPTHKRLRAGGRQVAKETTTIESGSWSARRTAIRHFRSASRSLIVRLSMLARLVVVPNQLLMSCHRHSVHRG